MLVGVDSPIGEAMNENSDFGGFWIRVGAYCIDTAVLIVPLMLVSFLFREQAPDGDDLEVAITNLVDSLLNLLLGWAYYATLHASAWQATLGKKATGLKVVGADGGRISLRRATARYFAMLLSALPLGIGFLMVGWTQQKQGLHDKIARTWVIRTTP